MMSQSHNGVESGLGVVLSTNAFQYDQYDPPNPLCVPNKVECVLEKAVLVDRPVFRTQTPAVAAAVVGEDAPGDFLHRAALPHRRVG